MRPLSIALTVDPYIPIPPKHQGGIERIVDMLARGLIARGHRLTLFAHPQSELPARLVPYGAPPHSGRLDRIVELYQVGLGVFRRRGDFDVVHSFGRLAALLPILPLRDLPKIQSYQRPQVPWKGVRNAVRLAGDSILFTGCSDSVSRETARLGPSAGSWRTVYNGVDAGKYSFVPSVPGDSPLVFLGRLEPMKGVHEAIAIARASGRRLVIAGDRVEAGPDRSYFDEQIAPHLNDRDVRYIGPVDDAGKNALLGSAAALLFPTLWEEAFGIVMVEAMACGTPVVGFSRGAVPEVIKDGENGYLCRTREDAIRAVLQLDRIDRGSVRADCEARFEARVIVEAYEKLYEEMSSRRTHQAARPPW
jgi:glycosyltransferase involved in cell wall biosynthesis